MQPQQHKGILSGSFLARVKTKRDRPIVGELHLHERSKLSDCGCRAEEEAYLLSQIGRRRGSRRTLDLVGLVLGSDHLHKRIVEILGPVGAHGLVEVGLIP